MTENPKDAQIEKIKRVVGALLRMPPRRSFAVRYHDGRLRSRHGFGLVNPRLRYPEI
jgi:hypothetical protein